MGSIDADEDKLQLPRSQRGRWNTISSDDEEPLLRTLDGSSDDIVVIEDLNDRPMDEVGYITSACAGIVLILSL